MYNSSMERRTIIFCGTPAFAVPSLSALAHDSTCAVTLVITQPDRPAGRGQRISPLPVKLAAQEFRIPIWQPQNINNELQTTDFGLQTRPDFLVVVAYGQILSQAVLDLPRIAAINVHASLLPRWRGASPIEHSILAGDKETGVTIQTMVAALDAGDILAQELVAIGPQDTAQTLRTRLAELGAMLLTRTLRAPLRPLSQPTAGVTFCRKLTRADGQVDPARMTAEEIDRRVRALQPWPGVFCIVGDQPLKILASSLSPAVESMPLPCAGDTTLHLLRVQSPGGRPMDGAMWMRGHEKR